MGRYDRAITVFSPDGHLFQVEYALEDVRKGNATVVSTPSRKSQPPSIRFSFESRSVRKIVNLDDHIELACAWLKADARADRVKDPATVEYITRYIAALQQKYTQNGGVRPFGLSTLIIGFDPYIGVPALYQTDPSGEFLDKNYKQTSGQETVKLAIRALLKVVDSGGKNIEVGVMTREHGVKKLEEAEIDVIVAENRAEVDRGCKNFLLNKQICYSCTSFRFIIY
ncbi:hypothetical protein Leryth_019995 [Lithospermum erythrorhizon]|nr:hypothetical protein Leryth_019995 [Lithospermum erythrorhizon]